jgi:cytidylate kinase
VRTKLVEQTVKKWVKQRYAVMDGRDIGTVVFLTLSELKNIHVSQCRDHCTETF